jgi:hypothetical protein
VSPVFSPEDGNNFSFRNVVLFRILDDGCSEKTVILTFIHYRQSPSECGMNCNHHCTGNHAVVVKLNYSWSTYDVEE